MPAQKYHNIIDSLQENGRKIRPLPEFFTDGVGLTLRVFLIEEQVIYIQLKGELNFTGAEEITAKLQTIPEAFLYKTEPAILDFSSVIILPQVRQPVNSLIGQLLNIFSLRYAVFSEKIGKDFIFNRFRKRTSNMELAESADEALDILLSEQQSSELQFYSKKDLLSKLTQLEKEKEFYRNLVIEMEGRITDGIFYDAASLKAIFDSLESVMWFVDPQMNLRAFNQGFKNYMMGRYGLEPQVGNNISEIKELKSLYEQSYKRIEKALQGQEEIYRDFYRKDGVVVKVVDSRLFPVGIDGQIVGVACMSNEVTEAYLEEQKLHESEQIIASVNKNISEAIYRSIMGHGLVFVNAAFVKMFGYESKEELYASQSLFSLYEDPHERDRLASLLSTKKECNNLEVKFRRKNGEVFTGLLSCILSETEDGTLYFDGAIRDITDIKAAEQQLKDQNQELQQLNQQLDSFVYSASHDLKSPLSSIQGLVQLAMREQDVEALRSYLKMIGKSVGKLDLFIRDIVDLSRNARQELELEPVNFGELVEDVLENYTFLDNFHRFHIIVEIQPGIALKTDKRRLKVVLNNLISNAIRYYQPERDKPQIKIAVTASPSFVTIEISDNGIGIEEVHLAKIFDMFYRATASNNGSGIGLYIVKQTLEKLQGSIEVSTVFGEGCTFTVRLPLQK